MVFVWRFFLYVAFFTILRNWDAISFICTLVSRWIWRNNSNTCMFFNDIIGNIIIRDSVFLHSFPSIYRGLFLRSDVCRPTMLINRGLVADLWWELKWIDIFIISVLKGWIFFHTISNYYIVSVFIRLLKVLVHLIKGRIGLLMPVCVLIHEVRIADRGTMLMV